MEGSAAIGIVLVGGEEVVVKGAEARELEKGSAAGMMMMMIEARLGGREAGKEGAERRVGVDEGGEEEGEMVEEGVEGEEEES